MLPSAVDHLAGGGRHRLVLTARHASYEYAFAEVDTSQELAFDQSCESEPPRLLDAQWYFFAWFQDAVK